MSLRERYGWHDDRPCPDWCVNGAEHLAFRLRTGADFWHEGRRVTVRSADEDLHDDPVDVEVYLTQREQVDERGHIRHPAEVTVHPGWSFVPDAARTLAAALAAVADQATATAHDVPTKSGE